MHERHACPATNRSCFNCGIDDHFGRTRLDTGCAVSLISEDVVTRQGLTVDTTSSKRIRTADGQDLDNSGTVTFGVGFQGKTTEVVAAHGGYTLNNKCQKCVGMGLNGFILKKNGN